MLIYIYDFMFSWKLKFWHQWWKTWKNDQIYRKRVVPSMMCLQFHSHKKLGSKNTLKRERAYASLQLTLHTKFPSNELLTSDFHQSEDTRNFCTLVTFLTIITFIMFFFSEIEYIIIFIFATRFHNLWGICHFIHHCKGSSNWHYFTLYIMGPMVPQPTHTLPRKN